MSMIGHYIPTKDFIPLEKEFVFPVSDDYFIWWLFKYKCVMCKKPATEINEIIPRSRSKHSIMDYRNRVTLCRECHNNFHHSGVTDIKMDEMKLKRQEFLLSMGRKEYI